MRNGLIAGDQREEVEYKAIPSVWGNCRDLDSSSAPGPKGFFTCSCPKSDRRLAELREHT